MIPLRNFKRFISKAIRQPGYAFKIFLKRLKADLYYRFGDGRADMPEAVTLFLTHRCNLRCKMCGQWGEGGVTKSKSAGLVKEEMTLDRLVRLIDDIAPSNPGITLFGGEPLLHKGAIDLIRHIKSRGLHCLVITNGFLVQDLAQDIVSSGLDELNLSLDGNKELHDSIRGMPGLFDKIMAGLEKIHEIKIAKGLKKPFVNIQCTITKYNYRFLEQMLDVARSAHADSLTFHNLIFVNKSVLERQRKCDKELGSNSADWDGFEFEPEIDVELLSEKIDRIMGQKHGFGVDFFPNLSKEDLRVYYKDPSIVPLGYKSRCMSPWVVGYVFPDGEVRPCLNSSYTFGNIQDVPFKDIWNSDEAIKFRRTLKGHGIFPACARCTELYRY
jgi:MoaA/NifB/PqqE/SkfB family radical SAM enzyme